MTDTPISGNETESEQVQPILVAIDFSKDSREALLWACGYASRANARLILLHVVHDIAAHPGFYHSDSSGEMQSMEAVAASMMDEFMEEIKNSFPELRVLDQVNTHLISGLPPGRIVEAAGLLHAGLIVMGCHGMTGPDHKRVGSVAEQVVKLAPQPVVVVKSEHSRNLLKKGKKWKKDKEGKKDRMGKKERKKLKSLRKKHGDSDG
jgi:nucleotide-binding universal stress UspA family protein